MVSAPKLCSFLYVQMFLYSQVDRLFQMVHTAISPSPMVLFFITIEWNKLINFVQISAIVVYGAGEDKGFLGV